MIWKPIPGWDRYEASSTGEIQSRDMAVKARGGKTAIRKGRILTPIKKSNGYLCVSVTKSGCPPVQVGVHRLVALAFFGASSLQVLHNNGDKTDNRAANLRYGTQLENIHDAKKHGTQPSVLTESVVREIKRSPQEKASTLAKRFGVKQERINAVRRGVAWAHIT